MFGYSDMADDKEFAIDPVQYGVLCQRVQDMGKKIDKMEKQLEELIALANKSRGGLWLGMSIISCIAAVVAFVVSNFKTY
jgi:hypothetical protein